MPQIIVIDDDDQVRLMLGMILEKAGYVVETAPNGLAGMDAQRLDPASLIITDIIMPEQEGIETVVELQREFPATKIIAISGGGSLDPSTFLTLAEDLGASCTFCKPVRHSALLSAIRGLIGPPKREKTGCVKVD